MYRRSVFVVVALLVASACSSGPTEADLARGEVIAADPVFGDTIDRPVGIHTNVIHGDDPISESDTIEVTRSWLSDGTTDHGVVAQLVDVAVSAGWVALKAECDHLGIVRVTGAKTFNDGEDFKATLIIQGPRPGDTESMAPPRTHVISFAARPANPNQWTPIAPGTPPVIDISCLDPDGSNTTTTTSVP